MAKAKGLKCSKNAFWLAIRPPLYCGKIFIPKYKDEEGYFVTGQHEPLITETLFYKVQDVLNGRKKVVRTKMVIDDDLPFPPLKLYKEVIVNRYNEKTKSQKGNIQQLKIQLQEENRRLSKARELFYAEILRQKITAS